jgi:hypothetical protein
VAACSHPLGKIQHVQQAGRVPVAAGRLGGEIYEAGRAAVARVGSHQPGEILRALDIGAEGIIVGSDAGSSFLFSTIFASTLLILSFEAFAGATA